MVDQAIQKKMATQVKVIVQISEPTKAAATPTGEIIAPTNIRVLRVRWTLQPARCNIRATHLLAKLEVPETRNETQATKPMVLKCTPRSRTRNSGIQNT